MYCTVQASVHSDVPFLCVCLLHRRWASCPSLCLQLNGVGIVYGNRTVRCVKRPVFFLLHSLVRDAGVIIVPIIQVLLAKHLAPVHAIHQDDDGSFGCLEECVEQREHVHCPHELWRESQLQDGRAELDVLAARL